MNRTREWAEQYAKRYYFASDLCGLCARASAKLFRMLTEAEVGDIVLVETTTELRGSHCFVLYQDRYILDVTATQFGYEDDIMIIDTWKLDGVPYHWVIENKFDNVKGLRKFQKTTGWPDSQVAR
jgi:hypothetical protein